MRYALEALHIFITWVLPPMLGLVSVAALIKLSLRFRWLERKVVATDKDLRSQVAAVAKSMASLKKEVEANLDERSRGIEGGCNVNPATRAKALKMHRLGQQPEQIAKTLRVSRGEVNLLLRVHTIMMRSFDRPEPVGAASEQKD